MTSSPALSSSTVLGKSLELPCGAYLKNRFAKSAMSETLGSRDNRVTPGLAALYRRWAQGGTGLLITGNVMIDHRAVGEPNNVVLENNRDMARLRAWSQAGTLEGTHLWIQLNHPGKQVPKGLGRAPVAPSAIAFSSELSRFFNQPRALLEDEINDLIERFGTSAALAKEAGFTGVQIHGAHGYLVSQFLSPLHNQRQDQWGGSLENRMRFVTEVYREIRRQVGDDFPVSIKLNSADFQRGGFTEEESIQVAARLDELGMDLIEISGGTYEEPAMAGREPEQPLKESTRAREAYFLEYAEQIRKRVKRAALMVTGGFRTGEAMAQAVESGATDLVGLARPLVVEPELPGRILSGEDCTSLVKPIRTGIPMVDRMALMEVSWYELQIARLAKGKDPVPDASGIGSLLRVLSLVSWRSLRAARPKRG